MTDRSGTGWEVSPWHTAGCWTVLPPLQAAGAVWGTSGESFRWGVEPGAATSRGLTASTRMAFPGSQSDSSAHKVSRDGLQRMRGESSARKAAETAKQQKPQRFRNREGTETAKKQGPRKMHKRPRQPQTRAELPERDERRRNYPCAHDALTRRQRVVQARRRSRLKFHSKDVCSAAGDDSIKLWMSPRTGGPLRRPSSLTSACSGEIRGLSVSTKQCTLGRRLWACGIRRAVDDAASRSGLSANCATLATGTLSASLCTVPVVSKFAPDSVRGCYEAQTYQYRKPATAHQVLRVCQRGRVQKTLSDREA
ncbi:hypothetical protein CERSUDRAFT_127537 [Gelatoporia subvermispora B]|uniref:Uncharacterized protein n=1 Tax=Ceriporiopsis subvermispora (strain B) TaxID=914234 RepID=M2Q378_CERS8|nr:hypothetical protein CERSUDRAFT_127537 [Gelatoporia subvermispora B]